MSHGPRPLPPPWLTDSPPSGPPEPPFEEPAGRRGTLLAALAGGVVGALVAALVSLAVVAATDDDPTPTRPVPSGPALTIAPGPGGLGTDIRTILRRVQPSVVAIETGVTGRNNQIYGVGAGSGVIISADGLVVTNAHVLQGSSGRYVDAIRVKLADGRTFDGELVGAARDLDIALIRVAGTTGLVPATLGDSDAVQVGDDVIAIGNALNLGGLPTVTRGIVSATDRSIQEPGGNALEGLIQTDAAINPGNSGGPLVNAAGEVIGINTAIIGDAQNLGFAISINSVKPRIDELRAGGGTVAARAFLGVSAVSVRDLDEATRRTYGITATRGAVVSRVEAGSAADLAGLREGAVITAVGDRALTTNDDLVEAIRARTPGEVVAITYERRGQSVTVQVTLGSRRG